MDTQRLILFVDFFVLRAPAVGGVAEGVPAAAAVAATSPAKSTAPADLPPAPAAAAPPSARSRRRARRRRAADKEPAAAGRTVTIVTDLYRAEIDTTGGAITQVALLKHRDPGDAAKPYLALLKTPERTFVAQSGLLGEGMPNHRTVYTVEPGPRELAPGSRSARAQVAGGGAERRQDRADADVPSRHVRDRRRLRHHECRRRADHAVRLLPVHARHQDAGHAELDGPGLVRRPGHLQRDRQVQEGRIRRSRQARGRSLAEASVHQEHRQRLGRDGGALLRRRMAAGRREEDAARVLCAQARRRPLLGGNDRSGRARSRRAPPPKSRFRSTSGRRSRTSSPVSPRASTSSSTTASSRCSRRRSSGS